MIEIRPFSNADLPKLAELWVIHHAAYRHPPSVSQVVFEQAVASRLFFDPSRLLVATDHGRVIAWCQWFSGPGASAATLAALCIDTCPSAVQAARQIIGRCERDAKLANSRQLNVGISPDHRIGYQGLEPIGHGFGIDMADDRTNTLLEEMGYVEIKRIDRWEVATTDFRPPISRDALSLRRSTRIEVQTIHPPGDVREAMIHFDVERYVLREIRTGESLASVDLWTSDPEIQVMQMGDAILGELDGASIDPSGAMRYLITQLIPGLATRRIRSLHRCVATDNLTEVSLFGAIGFRRTSAGRVLAKRFDPIA